MKRTVVAAMALLFLTFVFSANAEEQDYLLKESTVDFIFTAGYTNGGDDLIKVEYEDGDSDKVQAGGEALLGGGLVFSWSGPTEFQLTASYYFDHVSAKNGDVSFDRFPVEALIFHRSGHHRFGGGLTVHLSPTAEVDVDGFEGDTVNFDAAPGLVLEYDYSALGNIWLGLRYVHIEYKSEGPFFTRRVDGSHFGLMAYLRF